MTSDGQCSAVRHQFRRATADHRSRACQVRPAKQPDRQTHVATLPAASAPPAASGRRVALVIGNSAYKSVPPLAQPAVDWKPWPVASQHRLRCRLAGHRRDPRESDRCPATLCRRSRECRLGDGLLRRPRHRGDGANYLVPVDATLAIDRDVQFEAVPLVRVMRGRRRQEAQARSFSMLVATIPSLRNAPHRRPEPRSAPTGAASVATRSVGRGLAEVKVAGCHAGRLRRQARTDCADGEGGNSPFALAFVQRIATPGCRDQQAVPPRARRRDGSDRRPAGAVHLWFAAGTRGFLLRGRPGRAAAGRFRAVVNDYFDGSGAARESPGFRSHPA